MQPLIRLSMTLSNKFTEESKQAEQFIFSMTISMSSGHRNIRNSRNHPNAHTWSQVTTGLTEAEMVSKKVGL
jgi:hypothetical protein